MADRAPLRKLAAEVGDDGGSKLGGDTFVTCSVMQSSASFLDLNMCRKYEGSDVRLGEVRVEVERTCSTISGMRPSEMTGYP